MAYADTAGDELLSIQDASDFSGLAKPTLRTQIRAGRIPARLKSTPYGPAYELRRSDLDFYLRTRKPTGAPQPEVTERRPPATEGERHQEQVMTIQAAVTTLQAEMNLANRNARAALFRESRNLEEIVAACLPVLKLVGQPVVLAESREGKRFHEEHGIPLKVYDGSHGAKVIFWIFCTTGVLCEQRRTPTTWGWNSTLVAVDAEYCVDYYGLRSIFLQLLATIRKGIAVARESGETTADRLVRAHALHEALVAACSSPPSDRTGDRARPPVR